MEGEMFLMEEDNKAETVREALQDTLRHHSVNCLGDNEDAGTTNSVCSGMESANEFGCRTNDTVSISERGECSNESLCGEETSPSKSIETSDGSSCRNKVSLRTEEESEIRRYDKVGKDSKRNRHDKVELGRIFQSAVSSHDWVLAESLIPLADTQRLNDALCIALDSIWFLSTQQELAGVTKLIEKLIKTGARDFTRAALRTSFLASCVSACRSRTMNLAGTVNVMAQRLRERLQECNGDEVLKAEAAAKVQRFTEWALKCIGSHSRGQGSSDRVIAQWNSLEVDVDLALGFASHYSKISTMECLVEEGNAVAFLGPLMRAAERGCMEVAKWFIERGCRDMELCLALTAAASSSRVEIAEHLLPHVPQHVLSTLSAEIIKAAGERSGGSLKGVAFLLQANFLNNFEATYQAANSIAKAEDEAITPELRAFLQENWSEEAFIRGRQIGQNHYLNMMRVIMRGLPPLYLQDLPFQLQVAIAYLPLYKECLDAGGVLLSQWLRGQLVEAAWRLSSGIFSSQEEVLSCSREDLLAILESQLPAFLLGNFC